MNNYNTLKATGSQNAEKLMELRALQRTAYWQQPNRASILAKQIEELESSSLPLAPQPAAAKASTERSQALIVILTAEDATEVQHKMAVLADTEDLQDDYGISKADAAALRDSVPTSGKWIVIPEFAEAVKGEIADHCVVLRDIASDARRNREQGQALRISKQAKRLETLFALTA